MLVGDASHSSFMLRPKFAEQAHKLLLALASWTGYEFFCALIKLVHPPVERVCFAHLRPRNLIYAPHHARRVPDGEGALSKDVYARGYTECATLVR